MPTGEEREQTQRMEWADMQRRGHFRYVIEQIFSTIGLIAVIQAAFHVVGKMIGRTAPFELTIDIVGTGCIIGFVIAELGWFYMKRKFRIPPPQEDWMAK
jgi:hypothetical protein